MNALESLWFLLPYIAAFTVSLTVATYAWRHRQINGALEFSYVAASQAFWGLGFIFELLAKDMQAKLFWDSFQTVFFLIFPMAVFVFALRYALDQHISPKILWRVHGVIVVGLSILFFSDVWVGHGLAYVEPRLLSGIPFDELTYDYAAPGLLMTLYAYVLIFPALFFLARRIFWPHRLYRMQVLIILIGLLLPIVVTTVTVLAIIPVFHRDTSPITFGIGNLIIFWGMFRFRIFDIEPIVRNIIFDNLPSGVIVLDLKNRIVEVNPFAQYLIGKSDSEVIGVHIDTALEEWLPLLHKYEGVDEIRDTIEVVASGKTLHFDMDLSVINNGRNRAIGRLIMLRDITDQVEIKQELEQSNRDLQKANMAKEEFISNISHELRSPITSMKLGVYNLEHSPKDTGDYLELLKRESLRLEGLVESLLQVSRLDHPGELQMNEVDLNKIVTLYTHDRRHMATRRNLNLTVQKMPDLPLVKANREQLAMVVSVLLTNALNYTPPGGDINITTQTKNLDDQIWVGFSIKDTGPGISKEEQDKLFTRFYRGETGRQSQVPGTGLGLAIAKEIIERHHGEIILTSEGIPGKGTQFDVWFPETSTIQTANEYT